MHRRTLLKLRVVCASRCYGDEFWRTGGPYHQSGDYAFALRHDGDLRNAAEDVALMTIDDQRQGGVLGKLEPVVVDPAPNWPLFAEKRVSC